jgi:hypothetical protein
MSVDYVVRIVNEIGPKDERLFKAFEQIDARKGTDDKTSRHKKFEPFKTLGKYVVFKSDTTIETTSHGIEDAFKRASGYVYAWIKSRYCNCLHNLPDTVMDYYGADPGYSVRITYDESRLYFEEISTHIDSKIASRVWISKAVIKDIGGRLSFFVLNEYAEPEGRYNGDEIVFFSRPNFYGEVADNLGIRDVVKMRETALDVNSENYSDLMALIESKGRHFPVVVFNGKHEDWTTEFDIDFFAKLVGYYCHVRIIQNPEDGKAFAKDFGLDESEINDSITVFYRGQKPKISYKSDILESTYEVIKFEQKKYWNENGCRAYRRQLVSEIRQNNARQP